MDFKALFLQLATFYSKLTKQQKSFMGAVIIGIIVLLVSVIVSGAVNKNDKEYVVLFDSLNSKSAAKVIQQLEKDGIPYSLKDGNVIKVPKDIVYKERISIASKGIVKDNRVGFELFDTQQFGATRFDQNIKYLRALEGELSRTINALIPIKNVSVSLAIPKETLFVSQKVSPSASVMVEMVEGMSLSPRQVRGIKNLVAAAVINMKPSDVILVNSNGETLGSSTDISQIGEFSIVEQKYKLQEEREKQKKIIQVVSPFVGGSKKVVAQVSIDYDFSIKNSTSEKYDPQKVIRSRQITTQSEGVGSVDAKNSSNDTHSRGYQKKTDTTNYEVGKTVSTVKSQFARIKRITAAVVVDGKYRYKLDANGNPTDRLEYQPLSESELDALKSLVSQSIGINESRGDRVSIKNLPFRVEYSNVNSSEETGFMEKYILPFSELIKYILFFLFFIIIYKVVVSPFLENKNEVSSEDENDKPKSEPHATQSNQESLESAKVVKEQIREQLDSSKDSDEEADVKKDVILTKLKQIVENSPKNTALLLETLISEDMPTTKEKTNNISMEEKISILMFELGEDTASLVLSNMNKEHIKEISKYIALGKAYDENLKEKIFEEFYKAFLSSEYMRVDSVKYAREILYKTLGAEEANKVMENFSHDMQKMNNFNYLSKIEPKQLCEFIKEEHPQTIALVLVHIDAEKAAKTLWCLSDELRLQVSMRMAKLKDVSLDVVKSVSDTLKLKIKSSFFAKEVGGIKAVADVLSHVDIENSKETLSKIEEVDKDLAKKIQNMMFSFEDIADLDDKTLKIILRSVDKIELMLALKSSSEDLKQRIFSLMSQRARKSFEDGMQFLGAVKMKDVENAQKKIIDTINTLAEIQKIDIPKKKSFN